ncbi:MAG TPA: GNAT family N-acetyltransferase [Acidimicrobiales bacterium]
MSVRVDIANESSDELVEALNRLVPQLSTTAPPLTSTQVEELIQSETSIVFVAREGENIVGSLTLVVFSIPTGVRAWIEDVVVDSSARGAGIGEALTMAAIDEARRRNVRSIDLTTRPSREPANRLYARLGFERRETNVYRYTLK